MARAGVIAGFLLMLTVSCFAQKYQHGSLGQPAWAALGSNMPIEIGHVEAIFRYPVKSMAGERLEVANLGWHGLEGDRRLAFRRIDDRGGFPWLTAGKLPDLLLFVPHRHGTWCSGRPSYAYSRA